MVFARVARRVRWCTEIQGRFDGDVRRIAHGNMPSRWRSYFSPFSGKRGVAVAVNHWCACIEAQQGVGVGRWMGSCMAHAGQRRSPADENEADTATQH
jgi:hypothetical protein